jgi:hypothetical protein
MCKKRFFVILFYGWIISMAVSAWGNKRPIADSHSECTHYYVDSRNGNDGNDGHSARQAWKSLKRIKNLKLYAGDQLLLRRGSVWHGSLTVCGNGTPKDSIIVDAYGKGPRPKVVGEEHSPFAVQIRNSNYITVQNLEIVNKGKERLAGRCGIEVLDDENGISRQVHLRSLYIHDVNGTLAKHSGEGCGILIKKEWKKIPSAFDGLVIEDCIIQRCERNGMTWDGGWDRKRWFPDTHTIVCRNLIEEVPGDGIVPIGCDGVVVEYNLMRNCTDSLPDAAAGMWPWSCDNAVFQYNEVSGHHAPWDGQGFDADFNCRNTVIQYNYSHDNDGGFLLICNPGPSEAKDNIGNLNTLVQYNLSINDGLRTKPTSQGMFSPVIHIAGPCKNTTIMHNILYMKKKLNKSIDCSMLTSDSWGGYSDGLIVKGNLFYAEQKSEIKLNKSTHNWFENNLYLGKMKKLDIDKSGKMRINSTLFHPLRKSLTETLVSHFLYRKRIAGGEADMWVVNDKAMFRFFKCLKMENLYAISQ